ncbi:MAG: hypothetical protein ACLRWM_04680 [Streptococcus sp.]
MPSGAERIEEDSEESTTVFTALTDNIKSLDFMVDDTEHLKKMMTAG